jgi:hypothetical protein
LRLNLPGTKTLTVTLVLLFFTANHHVDSRTRPSVDLVFCLELSGSTNGLIDDLREKVWDMVNQVGGYKPAPAFRIGVVGFARPSFKSENAYVKVIYPLTSDFDALVNELYKIKPMVEKGDQFVGQALQVSIKKMDWSTDPNAIRMICLAGNGMVNAGGSDAYRDACEDALKKNIIINTLYCRTRTNAERDLPGWREIARTTGGEQFDIRIHKRTPVILTSTDPARLKSLAHDLNDTYIYYGPIGADRHRMMVSNDRHAYEASPMTFESRLYYKISDRFQFNQQGWDVVDYIKITNSSLEEDFNMELMEDSLRFKTPAYVRELALRKKDERNRVISEMRKHLPFDRLSVIAGKMEQTDIDKSDVLERVVMNALNKQAASKGIIPVAAKQDNLY